ncbi:MAG: MATE family efflux transporter [Clostridiales bacterium]|nr:MATE family efflux transporter [Clostridiales bacterium]
MARKDVDMTQGSILRHYLKFAAPLALGLLFQQLYNTVDTIIVGRFVGEESLAAVGSTGSIINMLIGIFNDLSMGTGVVLSQAYGAHDEGRIHRVVQTTIAATLLMCVLATALGLFITVPALHMMNTDPDVFPEARTYLLTYFAGISGLLVYNMGSAIMRAVGDSKRPLYFLLFSAGLNTMLDLVFVVCFHMGVFGVAMATIIAQCVSALLVLFVLTREKQAYGIRWRALQIDREELMRIFKVGLPSSVQQGLTAFSNVFVMGYVNDFGKYATAGWAAYSKLDQFLMVPVMAIAQASTTFVGQNWGARQPRRARRGVTIGLVTSLLCMVACSAGMLLFARPLLMLINTEESVLYYGTYFIRVITPFYILICFNQLFGGALRGIGCATTPTAIMLGSFVVFRQIYLFVTKLILGQNLLAVSLAFPAGWMMCSLLLTIFYRRSRLFNMQMEDGAMAQA